MPGSQTIFDDHYVTSVELCDDLGLSRASVLSASRDGRMPPPVLIRGTTGRVLVMLWPREEANPHINAWRRALEQRRGNA